MSVPILKNINIFFRVTGFIMQTNYNIIFFFKICPKDIDAYLSNTILYIHQYVFIILFVNMIVDVV